jgi:hypothetical protein
MTQHPITPIVWDEEMGVYVFSKEAYTGPSTKKNGRIATDFHIQHFIARQLEIIAINLSKVRATEWTSFSSGEYV